MRTHSARPPEPPCVHSVARLLIAPTRVSQRRCAKRRDVCANASRSRHPSPPVLHILSLLLSEEPFQAQPSAVPSSVQSLDACILLEGSTGTVGDWGNDSFTASPSGRSCSVCSCRPLLACEIARVVGGTDGRVSLSPGAIFVPAPASPAAGRRAHRRCGRRAAPHSSALGEVGSVLH